MYGSMIGLLHELKRLGGLTDQQCEYINDLLDEGYGIEYVLDKMYEEVTKGVA